jgi:hypothetical protein
MTRQDSMAVNRAPAGIPGINCSYGGRHSQQYFPGPVALGEAGGLGGIGGLNISGGVGTASRCAFGEACQKYVLYKGNQSGILTTSNYCGQRKLCVSWST